MECLRRTSQFLCLILFYHLLIVISQPDFNFKYCSYDRNYTINSTYQTNLNNLLSFISTNNEIDYGFYNFSFGQSPDRANAIALCRGDISLSDCRSSVRHYTARILEVCPNQMEAMGYVDNIIVRYSNRSMFHTVEEEPSFYLWNPQDAFNKNQYEQDIYTLMHELRNKTVSGNSLRKFATENISSGFQIIFGLMQCTPDLTSKQCDDCLLNATSRISTCCKGKFGGRVIIPSCSLRYENYAFTQDAQPELPPSPQPLPVSQLKAAQKNITKP